MRAINEEFTVFFSSFWIFSLNFQIKIKKHWTIRTDWGVNWTMCECWLYCVYKGPAIIPKNYVQCTMSNNSLHIWCVWCKKKVFGTAKKRKKKKSSYFCMPDPNSNLYSLTHSGTISLLTAGTKTKTKKNSLCTVQEQFELLFSVQLRVLKWINTENHMKM